MKTGSTVFYVLGVIFFAVAALNSSQAPNTQYLIGTFLPGLLCVIFGLSLAKAKKQKTDALGPDDIIEVLPADQDTPDLLLQANQKRANYFKLNANLGILGGIVLMILAGAIARAEESRFPIAWLISLSGFAWEIWGCVNYMRWKGYSGWFGFFGYLLLVGLLVLVCFPNRRKRILQGLGQERFGEAEAIANEDRRRGFRFLLTFIPLGVFGVFFACFLFLIRSDIKAVDWRPFAPEGMGFQVLMPGTPQLEQNTQETPIGTVDMLKFTVWSKGKREFYMVVLVRYPEDLARKLGGPHKILELGRQDVLTSSKGQIKSQRQIIMSGRQGLELELNTPKYAHKVRIVATENRVYEVWVNVINIRSTSDDVDRFLDSFQLTSQPMMAPE